MKIALFEKHLTLDVKKNTQTTKASLQKLLDIKNEVCKRYLDNKEQKAMFLVASQSDVQFGFEHPSMLRTGA